LVSGTAAESAIFFPDGLIGCPDWQRFVQVVDEDEDLPVAVLQSLDNEGVQLLVTDPYMVEPGYSAPLSADHRATLGLAADVDPLLYCTLTVGQDGSISANLLGPLVVNPTNRRGLQLVLTDARYSTRHLVAQVEQGRA
jgi:flagellar assembly factor FliW